MRINRFVASAGIASRRKAEELVLSGKIKVNGRVVKNLATDILKNDIVTFDDNKLEPRSKYVYLMLHKPKGYICSNSDEKGRKTVIDLLTPKFVKERLFAVGRLDYDTEGLLLLTNDGDVANRLMHPRFEVPKTYVAKIEGTIAPDEIKKLSNGVLLDGVLTKKCKVRLLGVENEPTHFYREHNAKKFKSNPTKIARDGDLQSSAKQIDEEHFNHNQSPNSSHKGNVVMSRVEVVIVEGRNRQVRRMFEAINRQVVFLKRTQIGDINLGGLTRGTHRELREDELRFLKRL